jgi:RNA polymerase sigma factor (sigma-70 family)
MRPEGQVLRLLEEVFRHKDAAGGPSDSRLLSDFIEKRDQAAFETLVRRHGPMVLGVCRTVLNNYHDAEDALQAVFLKLACKAKRVSGYRSAVGWLHLTALHTAREVRRGDCRRRSREWKVAKVSSTQTGNGMAEHLLNQREIQEIVHEAISMLSNRYRTVVLLCDMKQMNSEEAAGRLGVSIPTLNTWLHRGRTRLRSELIQRGVTSPVIVGGSVAMALVLSSVPKTLAAATAKAAVDLIGGAKLATLVSARVAGLVQNSVWYGGKGKLIAAFIGLMLASGSIFGFSAYEPSAPPLSPQSSEPGLVKAQETKADLQPLETDHLPRKLMILDKICVPALIKELESLGGKAECMSAVAHADKALVTVRWTHSFQGNKGPWTVHVEHPYHGETHIDVSYGDNERHFIDREQPIYMTIFGTRFKFVQGKTQMANIMKVFSAELDLD